MTVEASLVLPLFIFFMAEILSIFDMIRLQSRFLQALHETGTRMSEYAFYTKYALNDLSHGNESDEELHMLTEDGENITGLGISLVLSETYVRSSVEKYLGSAYLDHTCLEGGGSSVSYLQSGIMNGNDIVDLVADYRVKPFLPLFGLEGFSSQSHFYAHAWTGYDIGDGDHEEEESQADEVIVFITPSGSVYHRNRNCTYLKPSTHLVSAGVLETLRSRDGSKYYACERCHPARNGMVVIADYGNRFHSSASCTAIHRDVTAVPLSQVEETMRPCSKCGGA